jgi:hypothetical protein
LFPSSNAPPENLNVRYRDREAKEDFDKEGKGCANKDDDLLLREAPSTDTEVSRRYWIPVQAIVEKVVNENKDKPNDCGEHHYSRSLPMHFGR